MSKAEIDTFGIKHRDRLMRRRGIPLNPKIGDRVKICAEFKPAKVRGSQGSRGTGERFWVEVTWFFGEMFRGIVDNDLIYTARHGLYADDKVAFDRCNILAIEGQE